MSESKHTPGPWVVSGFFYPDTVLGDVFAKDAKDVMNATPICRVVRPRSKNFCDDKANEPIDALTSLAQKIPELKTIEANARLIAAAPDYDAAARNLARYKDAGKRIPASAWQQLYDAIDKAEGR
jgi:hypothetical protein